MIEFYNKAKFVRDNPEFEIRTHFNPFYLELIFTPANHHCLRGTRPVLHASDNVLKPHWLKIPTPTYDLAKRTFSSVATMK